MTLLHDSLRALAIASSMSLANGAVTLWTTTFTGSSETSRTLINTNGDSSFTDSLSSTYANLIFSDTTFTGDPFKNVGSRALFSPNTNVDNPGAAAPQNGGSWQSEFLYTGGTQAISLNSLTFAVVRSQSDSTYATGNDAIVRDVFLTAEYSINGGSNWNPIAPSQTVNTTPSINGGNQLQTFSFSSPLTLNHASEDLWVRFKAENANGTAGAYVNLRNITFTGTVVPEPSIPALAGSLGVLVLLRRRRH